MKKHLIAIALLSLLTTAHAQNLVSDGSFETPALTPGLGGNSVYYIDASSGLLGTWQTTEQGFEIWANPTPSEAAIDGTQHLEVPDSTTTTSTVFQVLPTTPGQLYAFSFFHSPRPGYNNLLTVSVDSTVVGTFQENRNGGYPWDWQQFTTTFTAASSATTISFADTNIGSPGAGCHIDDVRVAAVPEPSAFALLGAGFLSLLSWRRRAR